MFDLRPHLSPTSLPPLSLTQVAGLVSRELEAESVVVFDEAHNIDNVCIESFSVTLNRKLLDLSQKSVNLLGKVLGPCLALVWPLCGPCLASSWPLYDPYMAPIWHLSNTLPNAYLTPI